jgi:signal transduction histidine kinase/ligand-binding sensor domain-containing protein/CheY-like chemotaxis protein
MKRYLFAIVLMIYAVSLKAQNIDFNHLLPEDGLSQVSINGLYADGDGVIWMATRVGLDCYNGNSIQVFRHRPNDDQSLFCNNVLRLAGDGKSNLYLLCSEGVAHLDLRTHHFKTLKYSYNIGAICFSDQLYIGEGSQVQVYSPKMGKFKPFLKLPNSAVVTCLTVDSSHRLWIGTKGGGVYCWSHGKVTHPIKGGNITTVYEDSRKELWIGSWTNGFWHIDRSGVIKNIKQGKWLVSGFVRTFCEDTQGNMWIGTFHGLICYNPNTGNSKLFTANNMPGDISNSSIWCIIKDQQGTLWIGTYFGGVNYFNPEYDIYARYRAMGNTQMGLSSQIVGRMTEDDRGNLWICTEGGGLNVYHRKTHTFSWYGYPGKMISQNNLKAIYFDKKHRTMWVGTHLGGLDRIDLQTGKTVFYRHLAGDNTSIPSDIVRDIVPYGRSLIVATQEGVAMMDPDKGVFKNLLPKEHLKAVPSLCVDRFHRLWIATEVNGVYCYDLRRGTYNHYVYSKTPGSISSNSVNNVMVDKRGRVWFSTANNGLDMFLDKERKFVNYGEQEGLDGDCVYAAAPSTLNDRDLLLITNHGFSVFDTQAKSFRNYDRSNGFPLSTVNENALYVTHDGEVFFGGVEGMVSFKEKNFNKISKPYRLAFCRLFVNGKEVSPGDKTGILNWALRYTDGIVLTDKQRVFSIEYYTSNYIKANTAPLQYRLRGSSDQWISLRPNQHILEFVGLHPGSYTLELRSSREDIPVCRLKIRILPPWYLSWWAWVFYVLLGALATWLIVREYRNRIRLSESLKYEKQHVRDVEEQNQSKLRFFTNLSHEIRTPLTVINGLSEMLLQYKTFTPEVFNKVLSIYRNSNHLKELISELLDFRKQEQGFTHLTVQEQDLASFVQNICVLFNEYAMSKDISIVSHLDEHPMVWFDQKQMYKVVNNLISNAIKHTPQGGTITVSVCSDDERAYLSVADTGEGIEHKYLDKVFDRFYRVEEIESLSDMGIGIGLHLTKEIVEQHHGTIRIESEIGHGTTFTVSLLLGNSMFATDEISTEATHALPAEGITLQEQQVAASQEGYDDDEDKTATILIVEDNDDVRQLLVTLFKPYYKVLYAVDGKEGLETVQDELPDIVLSDILMPNMSGIELCKAIKQDFSICHIPVVLLTARTAAEQAIEGLKIGADDYVTKPFNNDMLVTRCNNLVNSRRLLQRKFSKHPHAEADMLASNPLDKALLDKAMKIIDKYYMDSGFNVETFAREMCMSRTALFTKWKALTGQTPKSFILNMRLGKAADMLCNNPEMSIADICYQNGFSSPRYFSKCFKDVYKVQPSAYRNGKDEENDDEN